MFGRETGKTQRKKDEKKTTVEKGAIFLRRGGHRRREHKVSRMSAAYVDEKLANRRGKKPLLDTSFE